MLAKPKYMAPSTNLKECVIDVNASEIPFSCIIDGNESISAWRIKVYALDNNTNVLDTGKQVLSSPFYPVNSQNKNVVFKVNLHDYIESDMYEKLLSVANSKNSDIVCCAYKKNFKGNDKEKQRVVEYIKSRMSERKNG